MSDNVNHPTHYTSGGIECNEAIKASMTAEQYRGFLKGNTLKYLWWYDQKSGLEDLEKARVYLNWLIEENTTQKTKRAANTIVASNINISNQAEQEYFKPIAVAADNMIDFICQWIADNLAIPCDDSTYNGISPNQELRKTQWCLEHNCNNPARCWRKFFDLMDKKNYKERKNGSD